MERGFRATEQESRQSTEQRETAERKGTFQETKEIPGLLLSLPLWEWAQDVTWEDVQFPQFLPC